MKKFPLLIVWMAFVTVTAFSWISFDRTSILYPQKSYSIWTYSEPDAIKVDIYYLGGALETFLANFKDASLKKPAKNADYTLVLEKSEDWMRQEIPSVYFEKTGSYIVEFYSKNGNYYAFILKTNVNGALVHLGDSLFLRLWNAFDGKDVRFTTLFTGTEKTVPLSVRPATGIVELKVKDILDSSLFIETPDGLLFYSDAFSSDAEKEEPLLFMTDRPLYKPGDRIQARTVFLKADTLALTTQQKIQVTIKDPLDREKLSRVLETDEWGGITLEYQSFPEDTRGHYTVTFVWNENQYTRYFELADYAKPSFTVKATSKSMFSLNEPIEIFVEALYYYGQKVSDATVHLEVSELPDYSSYYYYDDSSSTEGVVEKLTYPLIDGEALITVKLPTDKKRNYQVRCTVVDQTGREVEDVIYFEYIPSDTKVIFALDKYWIPFGQPITGMLEIQPLLSSGSLSRELILEIRYDNTLQSTSTIQIPESGSLPFVFNPAKPGSYQIRVIDKKYPSYSVKKYFFAYSSNYAYRTTKELEVFTQQEMAQVGEMITFNLVSSYPELGVLAIIDDGNQVFLKDIRLKNGNGSFTLPVSLQTTASVLRCKFVTTFGSKWIEKTMNVPVDLSHKKAKVTINVPEKIKPGEPMLLSLEMKDKDGKLLEGAVTLGIVDQAVLDLYGSDDWAFLLDTLTAPPLKYNFYYMNDSYYFYQLWKSEIVISPSENLVYAYESTGTLAQTKQAASGRSVKVRTKFSDTAFWKPLWTLKGTDSIQIPMPEDLTTWSIRAVGFTKNGLSGYGKASVISTLPITVNPVFPKFLRSGDQTRVGILVGNDLDQEELFKVSLSLTDQLFETSGSIRSKASRIFWFDVTVPQVLTDIATSQEKKISFTLLAECVPSTSSDIGAKIADSMVLEIVVKPETITVQTGESGILSAEGQKIRFTARTTTHLQLSVSANIKAELTDAIKYLIQYPYGCVEQTVSSFLPAIVAKTLLTDDSTDLAIQQPMLSYDPVFSRLPEIIEAGIQRLYGFQNSQGGWGWWQGGDTDTFMTAYAMYAFYLLRESGYEINKDVLAAGLSALKGLMADHSEYMEFAYYVIKLFDPKYPLLLTSTDTLETKLFLALSLVSAQNITAARTLLDEILKEGNFVASLFYVKFQNNGYFLNSFQKNALLLQLMHSVNYQETQRNGLVYYLFKNRNGNYWSSTKDTSFAVMALISAELFSDSYTYQLRGNLQEFSDMELPGSANLKVGESFSIPIVLDTGDTMEISLAGSSGLLWKLTGSESWNLKEYETLTPTTQFNRILEKQYDILYLQAQTLTNIEVYLPYDVSVVPAVISDKKTVIDFETVRIENFAMNYLFTDDVDVDYFELSINGITTGVILSEVHNIIGMTTDYIVLLRNPWTSEKGIFYLYFRKNPAVLKVGDRVRHTISLNADFSLSYSVLEDEIPATFIQREEEYSYYGKYGAYWTTLSWYTHKEERYDKTAIFYDLIPDGQTKVRIPYTITTAGTFSVPPVQLYEMYDPTRIYVSNAYQITVIE